MDDDDNGLSVGFTIDFQDSFGQIKSLDDLVGETAARLIREFSKVEQMTKDAINLAGADVQMKAFSSSVTGLTRERNRAEKAGEGLSRQMAREIANYGQTRAQILAAKVETAALTSEKLALTEQSERLRSQLAQQAAQHDAAAAATARSVQATRDAAFAHQMFEARVKQGAIAMREQEAASRAAAAAEADLAARAQPPHSLRRGGRHVPL
jgi:septal ring factor EnvC (AmiA/AmiB activator)